MSGSWLDRQACKLGLHEFKWRYARQGACIQDGVCSRDGCQALGSRTFHEYSDWAYYADGSCQLQRRCDRCGNVELGGEKHELGHWKYQSETSCTLRKSCRCGATEQEMVMHVYGDWAPQSDSSCILQRLCSRCGATETRSEHDYGEWVHLEDSCAIERRCAQCGDVEQGQGEHAFGDWKRSESDATVLQRRCRWCPKIESRSAWPTLLACTLRHDWSWAFDEERSCEQTAMCRRPGCRATATRTQHQYGRWTAHYGDPCSTSERVCNRCGDAELSNNNHAWGRPRYVRDYDCTRVWVCTRNRAHKKYTVDHIWGQPTLHPTTGGYCVRCTRCPDGIQFAGDEPYHR